MGSREGRCARCQWGGGGSGGWPGVGPAPSEPAVHCVCDPGVDVGTSRVRIYHPPRPSSVAASGVARAGSLPPTAAGPPAVGVQARGSGVPRRWRSIEGGPRGERVVRGGTRVLSASVRYVSGPEPRRGPACHVAPENTRGRARWTPGSALLTTSGGTSLLRTSPSRNLYPFDCCTDPVNPTSHLVGSGAQHPSSLIHLKPGHRPRPIPPAGMEMRDITVTPLNMAMVDEVRARRVLATLAARLRGSLSTPFKGAPPGATRTTSAQDHALAHITGEATSILSRAPNNVRRPDTAAV